MKRYTDIFFDLDNTIWNFSESSMYSLKKIYDEFSLSNYFDSFDEFVAIFKKINDELWQELREGKIDKDSLIITRFLRTLDAKGIINVEVAQKMGLSYLAHLTDKAFLEPNAFYTIYRLFENGYRIHVVTDGFLEVQIIKLKVAKLSSMISTLITAEEIGALKPSPKIFDYAIKKANANKERSIFVGDDYENDIIGAAKFGIDTIFYNKKQIDISQFEIKPTYVINDLKEILKIVEIN